VSKLFAAEGSNTWFEKDAADILPEGFTCPHCGGKHFTKEEDTLDGWFDSGSTHFAAMQKDQGFWPATMYIEGLDQYRGWFQSSLLTAVGALGKGAPFKECVTHGWTVDGEGKAMHKSLGNGMDPTRSSTNTAPTCCACGPAPPTTTWTCAAPTRSSSSWARTT
jgi:isoleucyl-tRNA synthetase